MAHRMIAREHVADEEVVVAITIDVGEIDAHGKAAGVAQSQRSHRAKTAVAIVDPDAVRRAEIIANIKVRRAVPVDVPEHRGKSPIVKIPLERLPLFIEKSAAGKAHRLKASLAVVQKKRMRFAVF